MIKRLFPTVFLLHLIFLLGSVTSLSANVAESGANQALANSEKTLVAPTVLPDEGEYQFVGRNYAGLPKGFPSVDTVTFAEEEENESDSSEKSFNSNLYLLQSLFFHAVTGASTDAGLHAYQDQHFSDISSTRRYLLIQVFQI